MSAARRPVIVGTDLAGATVLVTGVGRQGQLGEVVARALADCGAQLCVVDRDGASAEARAADLRMSGAATHALSCDLTDPHAVARLAGDVEARSPGGMRALVNLAGGYAADAPVSESDPEAWHRMFAINLTTAYLTTRAFLPMLRRTRGTVVFLASAAALPGSSVQGMSAYAASKSAVITLMRAVAGEERDTGVRANAIAPTAIRTAANLAVMGENARYVERETVADWVIWLCSSRSGPVTGQAFRLG